MFDKEAIKKSSIDYLSRREHSSKELLEKLSNKGGETSDIYEVLEWLQERNLQSDARFTESFVNSRLAKGHGPVKIVAELKSKGININQNELGLEQSEWINMAQKARNKRFGKEIPTDLNSKAKQIRFLQYRGFSFDQVKCALNDNDYYE